MDLALWADCGLLELLVCLKKKKKSQNSEFRKKTMNNTNTNPTDKEDAENTFPRNNLRKKKSYAEATSDAFMQDSVYGEEEYEQDEENNNDTVDVEARCNNVDQPREDDQLNDESWEINVSAELKQKMAGPWQTNIILKLMGKQLESTDAAGRVRHPSPTRLPARRCRL